MNLNNNQNQNLDPNQPQQPNPQRVTPSSPLPLHSPVIPDVEPSTISTSDIPSSSGQDALRPMPKRSSAWESISGLISVAELIVGALLLAFAINSFVFQSYQVFGQSMEPTLQQENRLIISKVSRRWNGLFKRHFIPSRSTIIVFVNPRNPNIQLVKRVIGLPGERVVVKDGSITVYNEEFPDGFNPDEAYEENLVEFTNGDVDITVPEDHIFVSGDNRTPGGSLDSRNDLGTVPVDNIIGTLSMRIFPLSEARLF